MIEKVTLKIRTEKGTKASPSVRTATQLEPGGRTGGETLLLNCTSQVRQFGCEGGSSETSEATPSSMIQRSTPHLTVR